MKSYLNRKAQSSRGDVFHVLGIVGPPDVAGLPHVVAVLRVLVMMRRSTMGQHLQAQTSGPGTQATMLLSKAPPGCQIDRV